MVVPHSRYRETGVVEIDQSNCKHCGQCAAICPADVLELDEDRIRIRQDSPFGCIACGHCMMTCATGSITVQGRGLAPEDVCDLPTQQECASAAALAALMRSRRSVRHFKDQELDAALLTQIVEMAESAPMGIPPWDVGCVVVRGRDAVQELAGELVKIYQGFLKVFRPWVLSLMRPVLGEEKHDQYRNFIHPLARSYVEAHRAGKDKLFYSAPAVLIFYHSPYADAADAAIACTYAMLAAESLGLGNTIIGGAPPVLQRNKSLCQRLGIPAGCAPSFALIVGHPATHFRHAVRRHFLS